MATAVEKDLTVHHFAGQPGWTVGTLEQDTLSHVRVVLEAEYPHKFEFYCNGYLSSEEESKTKAWSIIEGEHQLALVHIRTKRVKEDMHSTRQKKKSRHNGTFGSSFVAQADKKSRSNGTFGSSCVVPQSTPHVASMQGEASARKFTVDEYHPQLFDLEKGKDLEDRDKINAVNDQCVELLKKASELINDPQFECLCPEVKRNEWNEDIVELISIPSPEVIIGVLGGTGADKSSLINAILNEDSILPMSNHQACTAAVVELRFNRELLQPQDSVKNDLPLYKGVVEFISQEEWNKELDLLLRLCCDDTEKVSKLTLRRKPHDEESKAAWSKIDTVYGAGTVQKHDGCDRAEVFKSLSKDHRVNKLLCTTESDESNFHRLEISSGVISKVDAMNLLTTSNRKLAKLKRQCANSFRKQIEEYVYRGGDRKEAQSWPLVRKVVLHGPWHVLSKGACLVDLPGKGDDNAARAKIADAYLQNCSKIWIVAPIKRVVNDKMAKDLLGDSFKKQLLLDGNYSNVSFVCTHTDDIKISQIMGGLEEVARKNGLWEQMVSLRDRIRLLAKSDDELESEKEDIEAELTGLESQMETFKESLHNKSGDPCLEADLAVNISREREKLQWLQTNMSEPPQTRKHLRKNCQHELRMLAVKVRNEYVRNSLQEDFREGIDEALTNPDEEVMDQISQQDDGSTRVLLDNFSLEVFCTSSEEYFKLQGEDDVVDDAAQCFKSVHETGIPEVVSAIDKTTAQLRVANTKKLLKSSGDVLRRIYLDVSKSEKDSHLGEDYENAFEKETALFMSKGKKIVTDFHGEMSKLVESGLGPALKSAAKRGDSEAMKIVSDWFSDEKHATYKPNSKRFHWATLDNLARRGGRLIHKQLGVIDLNRMLSEPMESEYSSQWVSVMVNQLPNKLEETKALLRQKCDESLDAIGRVFKDMGMAPSRVVSIKESAKNGYESALDALFESLLRTTTRGAQNLNRSTAQKMREKMEPVYEFVAEVEKGKGRALRQEEAMKLSAKSVLTTENFDSMMVILYNGVVELIKQTAAQMEKCVDEIYDCLQKKCCSSETDEEYELAMKVPRAFVENVDRRNAFLPVFVTLCEAHDNVMDYMGVPRNQEERLSKIDTPHYQEAKHLLEGRQLESSAFVTESTSAQKYVLPKLLPSPFSSTETHVKTAPPLGRSNDSMSVRCPTCKSDIAVRSSVSGAFILDSIKRTRYSSDNEWKRSRQIIADLSEHDCDIVGVLSGVKKRASFGMDEPSLSIQCFRWTLDQGLRDFVNNRVDKPKISYDCTVKKKLAQWDMESVNAEEVRKFLLSMITRAASRLASRRICNWQLPIVDHDRRSACKQKCLECLIAFQAYVTGENFKKSLLGMLDTYSAATWLNYIGCVYSGNENGVPQKVTELLLPRRFVQGHTSD